MSKEYNVTAVKEIIAELRGNIAELRELHNVYIGLARSAKSAGLTGTALKVEQWAAGIQRHIHTQEFLITRIENEIPGVKEP